MLSRMAKNIYLIDAPHMNKGRYYTSLLALTLKH